MSEPVDAPPGRAAVLANEVVRRGLRGVKRLVRPWWMQRLRQRNLASREPVVADGGPVVSLTTYEPRWERVFYTIESIGNGRLRPSRLVLWVTESLLRQGVPDSLRRLTARGLELRGCEDLGPHKKYYPAVCEAAPTRPLVTADDDVLYPREWLSGLAEAAGHRPGYIHCGRAHVMQFEAPGRLAPYRQWPACRTTAPSALHFFTGVAGVLYPVAMQQALREAGDGFRQSCPRADDIWLNANAWRARIEACQTVVFSRHLYELPGTRGHGLARENTLQGGNDRQLMSTYREDELAQLYALAGAERSQESRR